MTDPIPKHTPLYFRKNVLTEKTSPNAIYIGFKATLPKTEAEAHEIFLRSEFWIVERKQFQLPSEAFHSAAKRFDESIKKAMTENPCEPHDALGISKATLKKRMKFVEKYLTPSPNTVADAACSSASPAGNPPAGAPAD